jgi:hypothetical protein
MKQCNGACGLVKPTKAFTKGEWVCKTCRNKERTKRARTEKYGITFEEFSALLDEQEGRCAICGDQFEGEPMVDHNHETRKVRGLLCKNCNTGLGMFRDNVLRLRLAAAYLGRNE